MVVADRTLLPLVSQYFCAATWAMSLQERRHVPTMPRTPVPRHICSDVTNLAAGRGIPAGDFKDLEPAIVSHVTLVNVHSTNFPNGEIRGQIGSTPDWEDQLPRAHGYHCHN
jgi:hypothetical protein